MSLTDPTTTIRTASDAVAAAATLMRQTAQACPQIALRDRTASGTYAEMSLASLLYAASSTGCGGGICWAAKALDNTDPELSAEPGWRQVEQLCRGRSPNGRRGPCHRPR